MNDELRKRAGSRWLGAAVFAVVLTLAAMVGVAAYAIAGAQAEEPAAADEPLRVPVLEAERQSGFDVERGFTGRVTARRRSDVGFELAGKLISIAYDDGETVDAGAVLAELDTQRLRARRAEAVAARDEAA